MENLPIIKEDGSKQRIDVGLTKAIADTLAEMIAAGKTLYPSGGKKGLVLQIGESKVSLSASQVTMWIQRETVIPETGETLRAFLDGKRVEKRMKDEQARQDMIREGAEKQLAALTGLKIKPKEVRRTYRFDRESGERILVREEELEGSAKMNEVIVKGLQFGLERLQPQLYGAKVENKHTHMIFDFAKLRKARRAKVEATPVVHEQIT